MTAAEVIKELIRTGKIENETFNDVSFLDFRSVNKDYINLITDGLNFVNCTFVKEIQFSDLNFENLVSVRFEGCTFIDKVSFSNFFSKDLNLIECVFKNQLTLQNVECKSSEISFVNNQIGGVLTLNKIDSRSLYFEENFIQFVFFHSVKSARLQLINLQDGNNIREINFASNLDVENIVVEAKYSIERIILNDLYNVALNGYFKQIVVQSKKINQITLSGLYTDSDKFGAVDNLEFKNQNFTGNLTLSKLAIRKLIFRNLTSINAVFNFVNVKIKLAMFDNVKISKIHLDLVEFSEELIFKNSDLSGLRPNNVTWLPNLVISPDHTKLSIPWFYRFRKKKAHDDVLITELKQQRDAYRQLKVASQNNHNQTEALAFYRNEMRLYWKEIRLVGGEKWYNTVLIFLNRIISDFGQNWVSPLLFLFGVHFILFMCIYKWQFSCNLTDVEHGVGQYFRLLNPVRVTPDYINSGMGIFTDFWMRVLNGFFIYHFLKASRKYGKGE